MASIALIDEHDSLSVTMDDGQRAPLLPNWEIMEVRRGHRGEKLVDLITHPSGATWWFIAWTGEVAGINVRDDLVDGAEWTIDGITISRRGDTYAVSDGLRGYATAMSCS
jgi:hypothetical protein